MIPEGEETPKSGAIDWLSQQLVSNCISPEPGLVFERSVFFQTCIPNPDDFSTRHHAVNVQRFPDDP